MDPLPLDPGIPRPTSRSPWMDSSDLLSSLHNTQYCLRSLCYVTFGFHPSKCFGYYYYIMHTVRNWMHTAKIGTSILSASPPVKLYCLNFLQQSTSALQHRQYDPLRIYPPNTRRSCSEQLFQLLCGRPDLTSFN